MTDADIRDRTRTFIRTAYLYMRPDYELNDSDSLLATGIIDSLGILELLEFAEGELGITVEDDEITEDHFGTVDAIVSFLATKSRKAAAA